eukprot:362104-Chlamydomonas_euryale.AAC.4
MGQPGTLARLMARLEASNPSQPAASRWPPMRGASALRCWRRVELLVAPAPAASCWSAACQPCLSAVGRSGTRCPLLVSCPSAVRPPDNCPPAAYQQFVAPAPAISRWLRQRPLSAPQVPEGTHTRGTHCGTSCTHRLLWQSAHT